MSAREHVKSGARWLLFGIVGSLAGIGAITLAFAWIGGSYTPTSSSDVAAWIQAIGSIAAIAAAYALGERQARKAREHTLEVYHLQRTRVELGGKGVVRQLYAESRSIRDSAVQLSYDAFSEMWATYLQSTYAAALRAFDQLPLHELGDADRVRIGFEMRGALAHATERISRILDGDPISDRPDHRTIEGRNRMTDIRKISKIAVEGLEQLYGSFASTYER